MKKVIMLSLAAVMFFAANMFAQGKTSVGIGVGYNLPMGNFHKYDYGSSKAGIGFGLKFAHMVSDNLEVGIGASLVSYKDRVDPDSKTKMIPILLNGRFYFTNENLKPYAGINLGMTSTKFSSSGSSSNSKRVFTYGIEAGVNYGLSDNLGLDFGVGYNNVNMKKTNFNPGGFEPGFNGTTFAINLGLNYKF